MLSGNARYFGETSALDSKSGHYTQASFQRVEKNSEEYPICGMLKSNA